MLLYKLMVTILICLLVVSETIQETLTESFCENRSDGLYGHKEHCSEYIACSNGNTNIMPCPKGLSFDSTRLICDDPSKAKNTACNDKEEIHYHDNNIIVSVTEDDALTDSMCDNKKDGLYSHKEYCTKYIACANNNPNIMPCPKGLWFDSIRLICDHPYKTKNSACDKEKQAVNKHLSGFCYGKENRLYPHKSDCSKFISCLNGLASIMPCPTGLWFDAKVNVCNFPTNAYNPECIDPKKKSNSVTDTICKDKLVGNYGYLKSCTSYVTCDGFGHGRLEKCPPHSNYDPLYKSCVWEKIYPCQVNPTSVLANVTSNATEMVNNSTEVPLTTNITIAASTMTLAETNTTTLAVTKLAPTTITAMKRRTTTSSPSRTFPITSTMVKNVTKNATTLETTNTTATILNTEQVKNVTTTEATILNTEQVKNFTTTEATVLNTKQVKNITTIEATTIVTTTVATKKIRLNETTTSRGTNGTLNVTTAMPTTKFNTTKPSVNITVSLATTTSTTTERVTTYRPPKEFCHNKKTGPYSDPSRCDGYIVCVFQKGVFVKCPDGLLYNPAIRVCDWAKNVTCTPVTEKPIIHTKSVNQTGTGEETRTTSPDNYTTIAITTKYKSITTPYTPSKNFCRDRKNGNYPDPSTCVGFIACFHGNGIFMKCPAGLFYNETQDACDWPENVNCTKGTQTPTHNPTMPLTTSTTNTTSNEPNGNITTTSNPTNYSTIWYTTSTLNTTVNPRTKSGFTNKTTTTTHHPLSNFCKGKKNGNYPDALRCDGFVACFHGHGVFMHCPDGLYYNETQDACDWPDKVNCTKGTLKPTSQRVTPSFSTTTKNSSILQTKATNSPLPNNTYTEMPTITLINATDIIPTSSSITEEKKSTVQPPIGFCEGKKNGNYSAPETCSGFISCTEERGIFMKCPDGLVYNPEEGICDLAENTDCLKDKREEFSCMNKKGSYSIPTECNKFYDCNGKEETPTIISCPRHTNFHPVLRSCVYAYSYSCEDPTFCSKRADGKYRNKNNCYGYYECIGGQTFPKNCDSGWRFNGLKCVTSVEYTCV